MASTSRTIPYSGDPDESGCVLHEGLEVVDVAREDDGGVEPSCERSHHGVRGGDRSGPGSPRPEPCRLAGQGLSHFSYLAQPKEWVGVDVASVIAGERLG